MATSLENFHYLEQQRLSSAIVTDFVDLKCFIFAEPNEIIQLTNLLLFDNCIISL